MIQNRQDRTHLSDVVYLIRCDSLAMESLSLGRDEPYIKVADLVSLPRMKKPEVLSLAENLKDLSGNPAKSPTGKAWAYL